MLPFINVGFCKFTREEHCKVLTWHKTKSGIIKLQMFAKCDRACARLHNGRLAEKFVSKNGGIFLIKISRCYALSTAEKCLSGFSLVKIIRTRRSRTLNVRLQSYIFNYSDCVQSLLVLKLMKGVYLMRKIRKRCACLQSTVNFGISCVRRVILVYHRKLLQVQLKSDELIRRAIH